MLCPVCNARKAKRTCPALGQQICTVCCGTKRLVEIRCPEDCGYLTASRVHPPAIVQRQQASDRAMLLPLLQDLSERQARLLLMLAAATAKHQSEALHKPMDADIAQAAEALAATLETASRGIVYEHQPASLPAARLLVELKAVVDETSKAAGFSLERDAAIALRRIEHGARMMLTVRPDADEFQQLLSRVLSSSQGAGSPQAETPPPKATSLIIP